MGQASADRTSAIARVVFGLLVLATVAAFFAAQRVKRSDPVVKGIKVPVYLSPNGDGRKDRAKFEFRLPKGDRVTVSVTDAGGDEVRRLADKRLGRGRHVFFWNGRNGSGAIAPDGPYYLRVILRDEGRGTITRRGVLLVTKPPHPRLLSVSPARVRPGARGSVTIRFAGPTSPEPLFSVYRTDLGKPQLIARFKGRRGEQTGTWDERTSTGKPAPAGTYAFAVTVENRALVSGSAPARLPPTPARAAPRTGVTIGGPMAAPPLEPVRAGDVARVGVAGAAGQVRWAVFGLGSRRALRRGVGRAPLVRVRVPADARTGVYSVRVTARSGAAAVPVAVRGRRTGRVLVVLPAITWQGANPVDDDADGFPDTLDDARSVPLLRPFANGRMPAGFRSTVEPLMRFLDSRKLRYDLTTDLALARGHGPRIGGRPAVVFAGSERWFTEDLDRRLREYVETGGRVASFGTDAFRRTVGVTATSLAGPGPAQSTNALGEQTAPASSAAAPLVVAPPDTLGLFSGTDGFIGLFTRFEQSQGRVAGSRVESAAGRDPAHPAFVAYKLGRGLVVRTGTPQWSASLETDTEVANVTTSLWSLLSR
ncbi:MAG: hypothetical protein QOC95_1404 [Thermoleophilaceae bacterium]|nr:hypothetical protein [Thermoleophilaceae bacterium]